MAKANSFLVPFDHDGNVNGKTEITPSEKDTKPTTEQKYFGNVANRRPIKPFSNGIQVDLTVAQSYMGSNAPLTSFLNPLWDDLERDFFWTFYLWQYNLHDVPPEGREINRELLLWMLDDPSYAAKHFLLSGHQFGSSAAAYKLVEECMKDPTVKQAMQQAGLAEQMEQQADRLERQASGQQGDGDDEQEQEDSDDEPDWDGDEEPDWDDEEDGDEDGDGDDGEGQQRQDNTSPEEKQQQAQDLRQQAQQMRQQAQDKVQQNLQNQFASMKRAGAMREALDFANQISTFLSSWGLEDGDESELSIEEIRQLMSMMTIKGLGNLTTLMGRSYGTAVRVLQGRSPTEIMVDTGGLTQNIDDIGIDQLAMLHSNVPEKVRQEYMTQFLRSGLPGVTRTSQAKQEGAFIWACDESSSMWQPLPVNAKGNEVASRTIVAKALCMGLARAAKENGQEFHMVGFATASEITQIVTHRSPMRDLLRFAVHDFGGGTDFNAVLSLMMDIFDNLDDEDKYTADIGITTDGEAVVSPAVAERLQYIRERYGARFIVLLIGEGTYYQSVQELADLLLQFDTLDNVAETLSSMLWT